MSKTKSLSLATLKKTDAQKFGSKKQIIIDGYSLVVDEAFRPTKVQELVSEYLDKVLYVTQNEIEFSKWFDYILLLMVRHFTSLEIPSDFESQVSAWKLLIDTDYFVQILDALNQEEMQKVWNAIKDANDVQDQIIQEIVAKTAPGEE